MPKSKTTKTIKKSVEKKEVKPKKIINKNYKFEVKVNDKVFATDGVSINDCLKQFVESKEYPFGAKTRMFIKVSNGKTERHRVFPTVTARRILMMIRYKTTAFDLLVAQLNKDL